MSQMIIPGKSLNDKYKLADFQNDISKLFDLYSVPVRVEFVHDENKVHVTSESGKITTYRFERRKGSIAVITNLTDGVESIINWR